MNFPIAVFPKHIVDYIVELNTTLNFHKDFLSAAVMFTVASVCGNKYKLQVKPGWEATPIFWFACVGYPGTIKTHPVKLITKPLVELDRLSKINYDSEMEHFNPEAKPRQTKPKFKQNLISDYTIEALHQVHSFNTRGLGMYKDELNGFLNDMNRYRKGSDLEFWLESFNNGSFIVNRATKEPIMINDICINIIGTIQHQIITDIISSNKGNGFIDRFLFTSPEASVFHLNDLSPNPLLSDSWSKFIHYLNSCCHYVDHESCTLLKMSDSVFKEYQKIDSKFVAIQNDPSQSIEIKNYLSKMKTYVPRFALLLAIIDSISLKQSVQVTDLNMMKADLIAEYFISTAKEIFTTNQTQSEIKRLVQSMRTLTRDEQILKLSEKNYSITAIAQTFQLSRQWVTKIIKGNF